MADLAAKVAAAKAARSKISGGVFNKDGVVSVGGKVGPVGAALGLDHGKPFGSANVNGKVVGSFGPQGDDKPKSKPKVPQLHMQPRDMKKKAFV